jgi:hypothetical protein
MARFSIAVFDALDAAGWSRFGSGWSVTRAAIESFPTHAWRSLGLRPLPGKGRSSADISEMANRLSRITDLEGLDRPSHDELQAVVAGFGGIALLHNRLDLCEVHGHGQLREGEHWREGYIRGGSSRVRGHHSGLSKRRLSRTVIASLAGVSRRPEFLDVNRAVLRSRRPSVGIPACTTSDFQLRSIFT